MEIIKSETNITESTGFKIGNIIISPFSDGVVWIEDISSGDSGTFNESELEEVLQEFYDSKF